MRKPIPKHTDTQGRKRGNTSTHTDTQRYTQLEGEEGTEGCRDISGRRERNSDRETKRGWGWGGERERGRGKERRGEGRRERERVRELESESDRALEREALLG